MTDADEPINSTVSGSGLDSTSIGAMDFIVEGTFIFLLPPSLAELEKRIRGRGTETEEAIKRRLSAAIEEIPRGNNYDYIITNEVVSDVVNKILHIIEAERCAVYNNLDKLVQLENEKV